MKRRKKKETSAGQREYESVFGPKKKTTPEQREYYYSMYGPQGGRAFYEKSGKRKKRGMR